MYGQQATWDAIRELAFGAIGAAYTAVGAKATKAMRSVKVTNMTDKTVYFTIDKSEDQIKLPPNSYQFWDVTTNKALGEKPQFFAVGKQFYCKYDGVVAPSSGYVSVEALVVEEGS